MDEMGSVVDHGHPGMAASAARSSPSRRGTSRSADSEHACTGKVIARQPSRRGTGSRCAPRPGTRPAQPVERCWTTDVRTAPDARGTARASVAAARDVRPPELPPRRRSGERNTYCEPNSAPATRWTRRRTGRSWHRRPNSTGRTRGAARRPLPAGGRPGPRRPASPSSARPAGPEDHRGGGAQGRARHHRPPPVEPTLIVLGTPNPGRSTNSIGPSSIPRSAAVRSIGAQVDMSSCTPCRSTVPPGRPSPGARNACSAPYADARPHRARRAGSRAARRRTGSSRLARGRRRGSHDEGPRSARGADRRSATGAAQRGCAAPRRSRPGPPAPAGPDALLVRLDRGLRRLAHVAASRRQRHDAPPAVLRIRDPRDEPALLEVVEHTDDPGLVRADRLGECGLRAHGLGIEREQHDVAPHREAVGTEHRQLGGNEPAAERHDHRGEVGPPVAVAAHLAGHA